MVVIHKPSLETSLCCISEKLDFLFEALIAMSVYNPSEEHGTVAVRSSAMDGLAYICKALAEELDEKAMEINSHE